MHPWKGTASSAVPTVKKQVVDGSKAEGSVPEGQEGR